MATKKKTEEAISALQNTCKGTLLGNVGTTIPYGVNGVVVDLPCGVVLELPEEVFNALKGHIIQTEE